MNMLASFWGGVGIALMVLGMVALSVVVLILRDLVRDHWRGRVHRKTHESLSEEEFLRRAGVNQAGRKVALAVREAIAQNMGVPPGTIHPSDTLGYISKHVLQNTSCFEIMEGVIEHEIEYSLGVSIPQDFSAPLLSSVPEAEKLTIGDIARFFAENSRTLARWL